MALSLKRRIIDHLIAERKHALSELESIAERAHNEAIHSENKSDGKYDTRAIEAGYLAGAQLKRTEAARRELAALTQLSDQALNGPIQVGALVRLKGEEIEKKIFLAPTTGGQILDWPEGKIQIVSKASPWGEELLGRQREEEVELESPRGSQFYQIIEVI